MRNWGEHDTVRIIEYAYCDAMFTLDENNHLMHINEPWEQSHLAPLLFVGLTSKGETVYHTRLNMNHCFITEIENYISRGILEPERYAKILNSDLFTEETCYWYPYKLPQATTFSHCLRITNDNMYLLESSKFQSCQNEIFASQPYFAIFQDGKIVSLCRSVRISKGHEACIETDGEYRRRGYAQSVLEMWISEVLTMGSIPLYSFLKGSLSSQKLAEKLGLVRYATGFSIW